MVRRSLMPRLVLWAAVCALLLRAGVPLLASAAAQLRGVPVAEICEVYGVALPAASAGAGDAHAHHHHHHADHGGQGSGHDAHHGDEHCALTALGALAVPYVTVTAPAPAHTGRTEIAPATCRVHHDACATWAARRKQGPPSAA